MLEDNVYIREAQEDEADELSHLAFRSKGYWDYPRELMDYWLARGELSISQEYIADNPTYVMFDEESEEIVGFYSIAGSPDGWRLEHMWIAPEFIGAGFGGILFMHACETAETVGAESLRIVSDPNAEGFYLHMGAERIGEEIHPSPVGDRELPVMRMRL